jgi:hypothetical protein
MTQFNPLQKYYRQPKLYISLPSKGLYYATGSLQGDWSNVPVFAMTGMDEIIFKTPDALYSGEATKQVIESCIPYIKDGFAVPSIDVDTLILAIRIATFGETLSVDKSCQHCEAENTYDIPLTKCMEYFSQLKYDNNLQINDEITLKIRPLTYHELNHYAIENFKIQKKMLQIDQIDDVEKQKIFDEIYKNLSDLQLDLFLTSIESVRVPEAEIIDKQIIYDWLVNSDRELFAQVKAKLESNRDIWNIPTQQVQCGSCQQHNQLEITLDQSIFFD